MNRTNELNTGNKEEAISIAQDIKDNEQKIIIMASVLIP